MLLPFSFCLRKFRKQLRHECSLYTVLVTVISDEQTYISNISE